MSEIQDGDLLQDLQRMMLIKISLHFGHRTFDFRLRHEEIPGRTDVHQFVALPVFRGRQIIASVEDAHRLWFQRMLSGPPALLQRLNRRECVLATGEQHTDITGKLVADNDSVW